jgi:hypothetical protein
VATRQSPLYQDLSRSLVFAGPRTPPAFPTPFVRSLSFPAIPGEPLEVSSQNRAQVPKRSGPQQARVTPSRHARPGVAQTLTRRDMDTQRGRTERRLRLSAARVEDEDKVGPSPHCQGPETKPCKRLTPKPL